VWQFALLDGTHAHVVHHVQGEGDLVTYLNVFRAYQGNGENPQWCNRNFLKYKVMARVKDIRKQLQFHLQRMRVPVVAADRNDRTAVALRKAVTAVRLPRVSSLRVTLAAGPSVRRSRQSR
jgi:hypothetical protein